MSIQKECEVVQSGLNKAINLLAEARSNTNRLSSCSVSEMEGEIADILDICHEGMSELQASMEQIQLLQLMIGNGLQNSSDNSSRGDKLQAENLSDSQVALLENAVETTTRFVDQTKKLATDILHHTITTSKGLQVGLTAVSTLCSGGMLTAINLYDKVISPIVDISNNVIAPLTSKESGFSIIKEDLEKAKNFHLGKDTENYEMLEVINKKDTEKTESKKKKK